MSPKSSNKPPLSAQWLLLADFLCPLHLQILTKEDIVENGHVNSRPCQRIRDPFNGYGQPRDTDHSHRARKPAKAFDKRMAQRRAVARLLQRRRGGDTDTRPTFQGALG